MASLDSIEFYVPPSALKKIGLKGVQLINRRNERGISADDTPFEDYSERTFARPYGGITAKVKNELGDRLKVFTSNGGKLWALVEGGYKALKQALRPSDGGTVNLYDTGRYAAARTVVNVDANSGTVTIGFATAEANVIALYHNVLGAGKRKVKRRDMGLTTSERQALAEFAAQNVKIVV